METLSKLCRGRVEAESETQRLCELTARRVDGLEDALRRTLEARAKAAATRRAPAPDP